MKLLFIYNTDGNPLQSLIDLGHKIISPETYDCSLCKLTHGPFTEFDQWKAFRKSVGVPMEFLHRDEFEHKYKTRFEYPVILKKNGETQILLSKQEIDKLPDLDSLIEALRNNLPAQGD